MQKDELICAETWRAAHSSGTHKKINTESLSFVYSWCLFTYSRIYIQRIYGMKLFCRDGRMPFLELLFRIRLARFIALFFLFDVFFRRINFIFLNHNSFILFKFFVKILLTQKLNQNHFQENMPFLILVDNNLVYGFNGIEGGRVKLFCIRASLRIIGTENFWHKKF